MVLVARDPGGIAAFKVSGCGRQTCSSLWDNVNANGNPAVSGGEILVPFAIHGAITGTLDALDLATGKVMWASAPQLDAVQTPTVANGVVYDADFGGTVHAYRASGCNHATCPPIWSRPLGAGGPPNSGDIAYISAIGDTLLVDDTSELFALTETSKGDTSWPSAPTITSITGFSTQVDLTWTIPSDGRLPLRNYIIADDAGDPPTVDEAAYNGTNIDGLDPGHHYRFHVAASNADGQGPWSAWRQVSTP